MKKMVWVISKNSTPYRAFRCAEVARAVFDMLTSVRSANDYFQLTEVELEPWLSL